MNLRRLALVGGILLVGAGGAMLLRIPYFYYHSNHVGHQLLKESSQLNPTHTGAVATATTEATDKQVNAKPPKELLGRVYIPALQLKAPLVEGTADTQLAVGVGHLKTSVMPGKDGTSVIAAHNATWFRHINKLKTGAKIDVLTKTGLQTFEVTKHKVVRTGSPVYNSSNPTIVLETCYPTNALYLTPYRLLVYGKWVSSSPIGTAPTNHSGSGSGSTGASTANSTGGLPNGANLPSISDSVTTQYTTNIPQRIVKQGITLTTNSLPMGELVYSGTPSSKFTQSNSPLSASAAAVRLYLAMVHASSHKDTQALNQLLPATLSTNPFLGVNLKQIHYLHNFTVTLDVQGKALQKMTAVTAVKVNGLSYDITVHYQVQQSSVSISGFVVKKR
ncbi:class D sortase [Alicyclobacillus sp. SO9]|uniref:class D sortase n=1 Tax=Alicyclobacillus sp. SO9 TaxID=2665646 RepID=UPI0018E7E523|nr:class D sortase [Alicyclobacillus sp. SO9]QQE78726.1 class D sortase [Alicyclobacillus sp. SO9]